MKGHSQPTIIQNDEWWNLKQLNQSTRPKMETVRQGWIKLNRWPMATVAPNHKKLRNQDMLTGRRIRGHKSAGEHMRSIRAHESAWACLRVHESTWERMRASESAWERLRVHEGAWWIMRQMEPSKLLSRQLCSHWLVSTNEKGCNSKLATFVVLKMKDTIFFMVWFR